MIVRFIKFSLKVFIAFLVILLIVGSINQCNFDSEVIEKYQPTGGFSEVDGRRIHFSSYGQGEVTLVMIAGLGESMYTWNAIEEELGNIGRVFMYDRSGLGNSDEGDLPRSVDINSKELNEILKNEDIPGPYVLVGHSVGGFISRHYANKYPEEVIGLFLIDPYQEMGRDHFGDWPFTYKLSNWTLRKLSWTGIPYYLLPEPPHPSYKTSKAMKTYGNEAYAEALSIEEFKNLNREEIELPIYLISAQNNGEYDDLHKKWHKEILSNYSHPINKHIIVEGDHHVHIEKPELVLSELEEFVSKIR